jgi:hypothetical protein
MVKVNRHTYMAKGGHGKIVEVSHTNKTITCIFKGKKHTVTVSEEILVQAQQILDMKALEKQVITNLTPKVIERKDYEAYEESTQPEKRSLKRTRKQPQIWDKDGVAGDKDNSWKNRTKVDRQFRRHN